MPRWFGALTVFGSIQPCRMVKNGPKKSAPECPVECGGVQSLFGQCPNVGGVNAKGCPLSKRYFQISESAKNRTKSWVPIDIDVRIVSVP